MARQASDSAEARRLHAMIERLCIQADLSKPRVAIAETPMPNAFAIGRSPKSATVCATSGIMRLLSDSELEAVLWPDLLIIGGGVSKDHEKFFPYLETRAELVPAALENQAGIVGAAYAASRADG